MMGASIFRNTYFRIVVLAVLLFLFIRQTPPRAAWISSFNSGYRTIPLLVDLCQYTAKPLGWQFGEEGKFDFGLLDRDKEMRIVMDWGRIEIPGLSQNVESYDLDISGDLMPGVSELTLQLADGTLRIEPVDGKFNASLRLDASDLDKRQMLSFDLEGTARMENIDGKERSVYGRLTSFLIVPSQGVNDEADTPTRVSAPEEVEMGMPALRTLFHTDPVKAVKSLELAARLKPDSAEAQYLLGNAMAYRKESLLDAIDHLNKAEDLGFDEFWVSFVRGAAYLGLGRKEEALKDLARAERLNPDHEGVHTFLKQLR